jgi:hypothetical protein
MIPVAGWKWCLRFNVEGFHETRSTGVRKCRANRNVGELMGQREGFYRLARRRFEVSQHQARWRIGCGEAVQSRWMLTSS